MENIFEYIQTLLNGSWGIGVCSGIVATFIWWFITHVIFAAKIEISNLQVYCSGTHRVNDYYLRIQNRSRLNPIYDIECYCVFKDNNKELVYVKDSRTYKFTVLGTHPTIIKTLVKKYKKERERFRNADIDIQQDLPHEACILLNSAIYKVKDGANVTFSQPLFQQEIKTEDLDYIIRHDIPHTLFILIETKSPFGTTRTISKNISCNLPKIEKNFFSLKYSTKLERKKFLVDKFQKANASNNTSDI